MIYPSLSIPVVRPAAATPAPDEKLRALAADLEAGFLSEMLGYAGLGKTSTSFGGGAGEVQFASFLRQEQAEAMVDAGGIRAGREPVRRPEGGAGMNGPEEEISARLDEIRNLLRQGRLAELAPVTDALERAIAAADPIAPEGLRRLGDTARRTATALAAAARGVRAAHRRLAEIRAIGEGFVSYDAAGRRDDPPAQAGRLTRRV